ncbi:hypothetical protein E4U37_005555 [Claviceps purpurea]|nr:hypothetical protein E4U37_005555 [Claviceps purpurea]
MYFKRPKRSLATSPTLVCSLLAESNFLDPVKGEFIIQILSHYSYMLAGLVYCVRVISLELLLPCKDRALQGGPEIWNFFEQRKEYLQDGSMSVLSCMISLLAYGKRIAMEDRTGGPALPYSMAMRLP